MLWFQHGQNGNVICMETTQIGSVRVQTVLDPGFYYAQKERDPNAHSHLNYELYFVQQGVCNIRCSGTIYTCTGGMFLLVPIGAAHNVQCISQDTYMHSFRFSLVPAADREHTSQFCQKLLTQLENPQQFRSEECASLLLQMHRELAQLLPLCSEKYRGLLQVFYAELFRVLLCPVPPATAPHCFSITSDPTLADRLPGYRKDTPQEFYIDILDEFFTHLPIKAPTLSDLSARLHLSISQTQRLIKTHYGISFQQKLIKAKIEKGKRLIATTQLSLEVIAESVGYRSYNAFFEAFCAQTGESPSQYRQSLQQSQPVPQP